MDTDTNSRRLADWSYLPTELLTEIAERLPNRIYVLRFRAVCKSWRSAISYPHHPNNCILSPILPYRDPKSHCSYFTASKVYVIETTEEVVTSSEDSPPKCWLAMVDEINPGRLYLRDPLSRFPVMKLPSGSPRLLNLLDFRLWEVGRSFNYTNALPRPTGCEYWNNENVEKVLMLQNSNLELTYVILTHHGSLDVFCTDDQEWTRIYDGELDDIVELRGKICAVDRKGRTYVMDHESLEMTMIASPIYHAGVRRKRLVESNGDLYLIVMLNSRDKKMLRVRVYKLNQSRHRWYEIKDLGDLSLFVGADYSFSVSSQECAGIKRNCVYVFKNGCRGYKGEDDDHKNPLVSRWQCNFQILMFCFDGGETVGTADSFDMLWPPPDWFADALHN